VREEDRGSAGPNHTHADNNCRIQSKVDFLVMASGELLCDPAGSTAKNRTTGGSKGGDSIGIVYQYEGCWR